MLLATGDIQIAGPGWVLAGGPTGTQLTGAAGSLYTYQAADTNYESLPVSTPLQAGVGYWAYFPVQTAYVQPPYVQPIATTHTFQVALPANHWVMVGNPLGRATPSGADVVYIYTGSPPQYIQAAVIGARGGALAFSSTGGTLTFTQEPPPSPPIP